MFHDGSASREGVLVRIPYGKGCFDAPHRPLHPVSFNDPPEQVSLGFEGNRMPARAARSVTEIGEGDGQG